MKRFLWLGFVACLFLICTGCGDTFRPIIIPNPPTFPNPAAAHSVLTISDNGTAAAGSVMVVDVSGDSDISETSVGLAPVHAVQQTANQVLVVNHSVSGAQDDSLSKLNFNSNLGVASTTTISMPTNSSPNFVAVAPNDTTAYVSLPNFAPPSVGVVNTTTNSLDATISVGNNPVAVAVTPNRTKVYVANQGDSTVSGFNTGNQSLSPRTGSPTTTASAPIWVVARSDNQRVYILEQNGTLQYLDTTATAGPDPLDPSGPTGISVPGAVSMVYDSNKNRLYIPGGPILKIVDVSQSAPTVLATISIPNIPSLPASVPATAVAVTALPDGSRAYVGSVTNKALASQVSVSAMQGDGKTATYTYTWTGGHDLTPGITVTVSGIAAPNDGFNGTYIVASVSGSSCVSQTCTFQAANSTVLNAQTAVTGSASSVVNNLFPQVTVVDVSSNAIKTTLAIPGFPDATDPSTPLYYAPICAAPVPPAPYRATFRFMMAAGGDSSRAYLSSCDGGNLNFIDTTNGNDQYIQSLPAPVSSSRAPIPPSTFNPPQNPVFLLAGP